MAAKLVEVFDARAKVHGDEPKSLLLQALLIEAHRLAVSFRDVSMIHLRLVFSYGEFGITSHVDASIE